jgi:DNA-binding CsgD family transcriptional regulator
MEALVGRERELHVLADLLDGVSDHGAALLVRGEAGVGKSALLASASAQARTRGMRVLAATGAQAETLLPFAGLHQLLHPLLDQADELPAAQRDALYAAFGMRDGVRDEQAPNLFLIALATLELLSGAAEQTPLLVLVEDAQWLDSSTCDALAFVARRLESEPIVLLLAIREGVESALAETGLPDLQLEGLDDAAASALLDARAPELAPAVRERLLEEAAGNPLALLELPAALKAEQLGGTEPLPPWLPMTTRLERIFRERVSHLPEPTRALLLTAALDTGELTEALQAATLLQGAPVSEEALGPAVAAGLAQVEDHLIRFRHPLVRSAIAQAAGSARLRAAHEALAIALAEEPERRVWHRAAAVVGYDDAVAHELEVAATRAARRGAQAVAVAALERAAALTRDPAERGGRLLQAVEWARDLGRPELVTQLLREVTTLELRPLERAWLLWFQEVYAEEGAWSGAERVRTFVELAERAEQAGDVERAVRTLYMVALRCYWSNPDAETRRLVLATAERLPVSPAHPMLLWIFGLVAPVERGAIVLERLPRAAAAASGDHLAEFDLGFAASAIGDCERSLELLTTATAGLRAQGAVGALGQALVSQAWTAICLGNWTVAATAAEEAARLAEETLQSNYVGVASLAQATVTAVRGDESRAEALAAGVERVLLAIGAYPLLALVQMARGLAALGLGRHAEAYEQLRRIFDPTDLAYHPFVRWWAATDYLEAAVHSDHFEEARAVMAEMEALLEQTHSPLLQIALTYARPLLAEDEHAEALYQASLGEHLANWPFVRARLQLGYGGWLRRHRRTADCRAPLRAAVEVLDALGALPWAERARQELRASGEVRRPRTPDARDQLSPQELQIAQLAAEGLSNREIGQRLYLSHRTVGSHLYRIFPKLGITSRAELHMALEGARRTGAAD